VFISFDNGAHWQSFQLNLPNVPVSDIKVHHKDLIVSTQGRAIWILDNITPLHQLSSQLNANVHLFKPRDGYRTRVGPTLAPAFDYYLSSVPAHAVSIEILDSRGNVLNTYSSETPSLRSGRNNAAAPESRLDPDAAPTRRAAPAPRVTKNAGLNRFVWDVRNQQGVILPPGQYQVRLKVDDVDRVQPINVLIDPRVAADGVTLADLQEQFEHNMHMRELVSGVTQLATRVREAQNKLRESPDANTLSRLNAIAARLFTEPVRYGKPGLQAHVNYLAGMTANVDQKIGRDAVERYEELKKEFEALRAETDQLIGSNSSTTSSTPE
jgi:hypothetical protein